MTVRRLQSLMSALPGDSTLARKLTGWTDTEELLALNAELTHATLRVLIAANTTDSTNIPDPLTIPRPNRPAAGTDRAMATPAEMTSFFGATVVVDAGADVTNSGRTVS